MRGSVAKQTRPVDDFAEHELWTPYFGEGLNLSLVPAGEYPATKTHAISCFENSCKLAVIINDIILQLYSRRASTADLDLVDATLKGIKDRLDEWRDNSPPHLKYEPDNLPDVCPPPHILTQKCAPSPPLPPFPPTILENEQQTCWRKGTS